MGSRLAPVLANLFMGYREQLWLENYDGTSVLFYRWYVDDTFCVFHNENDAMLFLDYLNRQHVNIKFTFEKEKNGKLPFLDVLVTKSTNTCTTTTFHKKTYTGLLMNFLSFSPMNYKIGLIKTLIDRTRKINNTETGFKEDLNKLIFTLKRNSFPFHIINKVIRKYNEEPSHSDQTKHTEDDTGNTRYLKVSYTDFYSKIKQRKLAKTDVDTVSRHLHKEYKRNCRICRFFPRYYCSDSLESIIYNVL